MLNNTFNAGVAAGSALRKALAGKQGLVIAHRLPGRRRYSCAQLKGEGEICSLLEQALCAYEGVDEVRANPYTGSLTLCFHCAENDIDALADAASHIIAGCHAIHEKSFIPNAMLSAGDSLTDALRLLREQVGRFLRREEPLFLSRITGLLLLGWGLYLVVGRGDRPSGPQMFWWGIGLLLRQSHRHPQELIAGASAMLKENK